MKRLFPRVLFLLLLALAVAIPCGLAFGDAGGFSGSSDFSSSGGDYSGGSSDSGAIGELIFYLLFVALADGKLSGGEIAVIVIILLFGGLFFFAKGKSKGTFGGKGSKARKAPVKIEDTFDSSKLQPVANLAQHDPEFSSESIREKISNWYVQMQNAWTDGDLSPLRPYFSDALYAQFARQLNNLNKQGLTNYVDRIAVLGVQIDGWYEEAGEEKLVATVTTRICDYTVDRQGVVVTGSREDEKFMTYRYILARTVGTQTTVEGAMRTVNCPNCAAALDINQTARCPFCDSIVTVEEHDWVISAIQGLSQRTA